MGSWITDGSKGFSVKKGTLKKEPTDGLDDIFNAMWKEGEGVSSGQHYWKIKVKLIGNGAGVGLTSNQHFKMGYDCKSITYSGDLSIGARYGKEPRLVAEFGPKLKDGDTIGIFAVFEGARLKVYFDVNGTSLGLTFDVPASTFESIFPMVSFYFAGSATCTKHTDIPKDITIRAPNVFRGIEGRWRLAIFDGQQIPTPIAPETAISNTGPDKYKWSVNKFHTILTKEANGTWKSQALVMPGRSRSPKKQKTQKLVETEQKIVDLMRAVEMVELNGDGTLSIRSDSNNSRWTRPKTAPFVGGPFEAVPSCSTR